MCVCRTYVRTGHCAMPRTLRHQDIAILDIISQEHHRKTCMPERSTIKLGSQTVSESPSYLAVSHSNAIRLYQHRNKKIRDALACRLDLAPACHTLQWRCSFSKTQRQLTLHIVNNMIWNCTHGVFKGISYKYTKEKPA